MRPRDFWEILSNLTQCSPIMLEISKKYASVLAEMKSRVILATIFFFPTSNFVNFYYQIKTLIFQCV